MSKWLVVLVAHNNERRYYVEAPSRENAVHQADAQWLEEFGLFGPSPRVVTVEKR